MMSEQFTPGSRWITKSDFHTPVSAVVLPCSEKRKGYRWCYVTSAAGQTYDWVEMKKFRTGATYVEQTAEEKAYNVQAIQSVEKAFEFAFSLKDAVRSSMEDNADQLNAGLHMISVYEQLMLTVEGAMHPAYRKNLEQFRKETLCLSSTQK
jgi:hypothetical protein